MWRRSVAAHAYWELTRQVPQWSADYAHALQFVDWSPTDAAGAQALAEYLHHQLQLAQSLEGDARLHHSRALTFTIEQLRLPMLPPNLSEQPMAAVHDWCGFAMRTVANADEEWALVQARRERARARKADKGRGWRLRRSGEDADDEESDDETTAISMEDGFTDAERGAPGGVSVEGEGGGEGGGGGGGGAGGAAGSKGDEQTEAEMAEEMAYVRQQMMLLELCVACVTQSSHDFFVIQVTDSLHASCVDSSVHLPCISLTYPLYHPHISPSHRVSSSHYLSLASAHSSCRRPT